jgi:hypothetical protein
MLGCGGGDLAPVHGKVTTAKGEPVKGGTLIFSPTGEGSSGLPATAEVQPDGTYTLKTNDSTGAKIGRLVVTYTPPAQELTEEQRTNPKYIAPPPPYMGLVPKPKEVEVKPGDNAIDLQLVRPGM